MDTPVVHIAEGRLVMTWSPEGTPLGLISGLLHDTSPRGFEVDWIVRFPESRPGAGTEMCAALLPHLAHKYRLGWVLVKVRDDYKPAWLSQMARRFGFVLHERQGATAFWRLDLP
jgi:hypothetical protein